jgi:hypothetical protein
MDYIFKCKKCYHELYVSRDKIDDLCDYDCPSCGEEGYLNWIYLGLGILDDCKENIDSGGS